MKLTLQTPTHIVKRGFEGVKLKLSIMCVTVNFKSNVNFYQILVHVTVIFRNLIFVCITIKDKLIKHLYDSHLRNATTQTILWWHYFKSQLAVTLKMLCISSNIINFLSFLNVIHANW